MPRRANLFFPHKAAYFISNLRNLTGSGAYNAAQSLHRDTIGAVLHWLISDCRLFGLTAQNWMWVFHGGLLLYIAVLILVRRRQADTR